MAATRGSAQPTAFGRTLWRASRRKVAVFLVAATATVGAAVGSAFGNPALDTQHQAPSTVDHSVRQLR